MIANRAVRPLALSAAKGLRLHSYVLAGLHRGQFNISRDSFYTASLNRNNLWSAAAKSLASDRPRPFSTSKCLLKKGGKATRDEGKATVDSEPTADPFDLTALESEIGALIERLKNDLSKLRAGGRFNTEALDNLRVQPDKKTSTMVKLPDVATVIPKGRTVQIIVGEQEHVKPVMTAIQSSKLSLTPQPDPTGNNPLLLIINIPPPTIESRQAVVTEAKKAGEKAGTSLRDARSKQQKQLKSLSGKGGVRPDDLRKAQGLMEKTVEKSQGEIKKIVDGAKKVLEAG